jgi:hypothetical protein
MEAVMISAPSIVVSVKVLTGMLMVEAPMAKVWLVERAV